MRIVYKEIDINIIKRVALKLPSLLNQNISEMCFFWFVFFLCLFI